MEQFFDEMGCDRFGGDDVSTLSKDPTDWTADQVTEFLSRANRICSFLDDPKLLSAQVNRGKFTAKDLRRTVLCVFGVQNSTDDRHSQQFEIEYYLLHMNPLYRHVVDQACAEFRQTQQTL